VFKATAYVHDYVGYTHNAGAETTMHDLLRAMVQEGWEVEVILSREHEEVTGPYEVDGVKVTPFTDNRQIITASLTTNLLISHLENCERVAFVGKKYRVPTVQIVHNDMDITKGYSALPWNLLVMNTEWVKQSFLERPVNGSEIDPKRLTVVHPRVSLGRYFPSPQRASEYDVTLVNLWDGSGRGRDGKGAHTFYEMARRFPRKKFLGVLGGYGEQRIEPLPNVSILPHTTNMVQDVYHRTRVLLMPSRYESFGRVAIEGAACAVPTVASPTPGLREALGPQNFYVDPDNYDDWERCIKFLDEEDIYKANRHTALRRAKYWHDKQDDELTAYLEKVNSIAHTGKMLRGW
jgi:glycosyltransferase involved in cell wall biosynthesis